MSFLLKRKIFFLFVFLFLFLIQLNITHAQEFTELTPEEQGITPELTQEQFSEADAFVQEFEDNENDNELGKWAMRIVEGLSAAALPFFALGAIPIGMLFFGLSSLVLGMASYGIDLALQIGVNLMSSIVHSPSDPVKTSWEIFRNISNVGIIFIILFIAIKTILRASGYDGKVLLGRVIIAALLINFSFLFGAIIVDVSNEMSLEIYKKVAKVTNHGQESEKADIGQFMFEKASPSFFQSAIAKTTDPNAEKFFNETFEQQGQSNTFTNALRSAALWTTNLSLGFIMGTIANFILAAVLFIAMFMIYARVIIILLLLVVSPIAFAAMILPNTQKLSKEWWESLIGQSFFLPAFLLFLLVGLKIAEKLPEQEGVVNSADQLQLTSLASYAAIFTPHVFKYAMVIGLFIAALMAAKKVQSMGSAAVGKISTSITNATGGAVAAAGAYVGRNTVGATANYYADKLAKTQFATTRTGMALLDGMKGVAKNSFDARESRAFKGVASATGVGGDFAKTLKPAKDGYTGQKKRMEDERIRLANNLSNETTKEQDADAKALADSMINMVSNDTGVITERQNVKSATAALKSARASGNVAAIQAAQVNLQSAKAAATAAEEAVKETAAYKAQEKAINSIGSARKKYAQNLEKNPGVMDSIIPASVLGMPGATRWLPSQRSADKSAAKKIMKEKSESEKILDALRKLEDKDK